MDVPDESSELGSVSRWIGDSKERDASAEQKLFERYWDSLLRLARRRMAGVPLATSDEEDIAISAFHSFFRGANAGRFPQLKDRHDLWRILLTIAQRKIAHAVRYDRAEKRAAPPPRSTRGGWGRFRGRAVCVGTFA